ncbi:MAG TPA: hypothetical protein VLK65_22420 [Vicinamibacteria bacterium]|nr:hypothetical protein [Vicinamibacteria bacterium]
MQAAKAAKAAFGDAQPLQVGEHDLARIADDDPLHLALAVDENADLSANPARNLGELPCEIVSQQLVRRESPLVQLFELPPFTGPEPRGVAF